MKGSFTPLFYNIHETRSLLTILSDGSVKIKISFFGDIFSRDRIGGFVTIVREFIDPSVIENISDERMLRDPITVEPMMFRDGYNGIKQMIKRIKEVDKNLV